MVSDAALLLVLLVTLTPAFVDLVEGVEMFLNRSGVDDSNVLGRGRLDTLGDGWCGLLNFGSLNPVVCIDVGWCGTVVGGRTVAEAPVVDSVAIRVVEEIDCLLDVIGVPTVIIVAFGVFGIWAEGVPPATDDGSELGGVAVEDVPTFCFASVL